MLDQFIGITGDEKQVIKCLMEMWDASADWAWRENYVLKHHTSAFSEIFDHLVRARNAENFTSKSNKLIQLLCAGILCNLTYDMGEFLCNGEQVQVEANRASVDRSFLHDYYLQHLIAFGAIQNTLLVLSDVVYDQDLHVSEMMDVQAAASFVLWTLCHLPRGIDVFINNPTTVIRQQIKIILDGVLAHKNCTLITTRLYGTLWILSEHQFLRMLMNEQCDMVKFILSSVETHYNSNDLLVEAYGALKNILRCPGVVVIQDAPTVVKTILEDIMRLRLSKKNYDLFQNLLHAFDRLLVNIAMIKVDDDVDIAHDEIYYILLRYQSIPNLLCLLDRFPYVHGTIIFKILHTMFKHFNEPRLCNEFVHNSGVSILRQALLKIPESNPTEKFVAAEIIRMAAVEEEKKSLLSRGVSRLENILSGVAGF